MFSKPINLFNTWDPASQKHDPRIQEIVYYCASRLRAILLVATKMKDPENRPWVMGGLLYELQFTHAHIGMAAAIGHIIDIPIVIRGLASHVYRAAPGATSIDWDWEFLLALDAGDDEEDLDAVAATYYSEWWSLPSEPAELDFLSYMNMEACLKHHRVVTGIKEILPPTLLKTAEKWSRHLADSGPPGKELQCDKSRMYRGLSLGVMLDLQDARNHVEGVTVAQRARVETSKRQAAGFFQLHEAAMQLELVPEVGKGKGKARETVTETAERLRAAAAEDLIQLELAPRLKWSSGPTLTEENVLETFRLSTHSGRQHSGYVNDLPAGRLAADSLFPSLPSSTVAVAGGKPLTNNDSNIPDVPLSDTEHFLRAPLRSYYGPPPRSTIPPPDDKDEPEEHAADKPDVIAKSAVCSCSTEAAAAAAATSPADSNVQDADDADDEQDSYSGSEHGSDNSGSEGFDPSLAFPPRVSIPALEQAAEDFSDSGSEGFDPSLAFPPRVTNPALEQAAEDNSDAGSDVFDSALAFLAPRVSHRDLEQTAEDYSDSGSEGFDPSLAFPPRISIRTHAATLSPRNVSTASVDKSDFDPEDSSDCGPERAFPSVPGPLSGTFTAADFGPIREEDLEPTESE